MAHGVKDSNTREESSDTRDFKSRVHAALASSDMSQEARRDRMSADVERLREMHRWTLEQTGEPLPEGWAAKMVRESRP